MKMDAHVKDPLKDSLFKLIKWQEQNGYASFDHYDFWGHKSGAFARSFHNKHRLLGLPLVGLIQFTDIFFPGTRRFIAQKNISPEAMPYFASGYMRLFKIYNNDKYLSKAFDCLKWLEANYSKTKSGQGWGGLQFDWPSREFISRHSPCVTLTSYSTDAFLEAYYITGYKHFLDIATATAEFVAKDLNRVKIDDDRLKISYTPDCRLYVINANSYGAKILYDVASAQGMNRDYTGLADNITNYILSEQNADGSWYYWDKAEGYNFIDCFHTAFVLENLYSVYLKNRSDRIKTALFKGYDFFKNNFVREDYSCRHYYKYTLPTGIRVDIRSCAEAILCFSTLSDIMTEAMGIAEKIALWTIKNMQDKKGYFYFRKYGFYTSKMAYIRWGQAPVFNAFTYLLQKMQSPKKI